MGAPSSERACYGDDVWEDFTELHRLYNFADDDSKQFTRWQMQVALRHGRSLESNVAWLDAMAEMMSEFVTNWPEPKRVKTGLALIAKTLRAALAQGIPTGTAEPLAAPFMGSPVAESDAPKHT